MPTTSRIQPLSREVEIAVSNDLSRLQRSMLVAEVAADDISKISRDNNVVIGAHVPHKTFVDGNESERFETVNPDRGTIAAVWNLDTDVVQIVGDMLRQHSPIGSTGRDPHPGLYKASHILFADGVQVNAPDPTLNAKEWVYISGVPYARKLEKKQADGIYEAVAALARQRFGNTAKITFAFRSLAAGSPTALGEWSAKTKSGRHVRSARRSEWLTRQPAIVITPL